MLKRHLRFNISNSPPFRPFPSPFTPLPLPFKGETYMFEVAKA